MSTQRRDGTRPVRGLSEIIYGEAPPQLEVDAGVVVDDQEAALGDHGPPPDPGAKVLPPRLCGGGLGERSPIEASIAAVSPERRGGSNGRVRPASLAVEAGSFRRRCRLVRAARRSAYRAGYNLPAIKISTSVTSWFARLHFGRDVGRVEVASALRSARWRFSTRATSMTS